MQSNRELLAKADLALSELTSGGGLLQPEQSLKFMRLAIAEAKVMKRASVIPMKAASRIVDKARFSSRIMHKAASGNALSLADRSKPALGKVTLSSVEFKAQVNLTTSELQDNIEGQGFRDTIMELMAERVALDIDEVIVLGDVTSADEDLNSMDGLLAAATSNTVAAGSVPLNKTVLKLTMKAMPNAFLRDPSRLNYFTSLDAAADYHDAMADRIGQVGDSYVMENKPLSYRGAEVVGCANFAENTASMILTDPTNILIGMQQDIMFETDKDIEAGVVMLVATLRWVFKYAEETAVVKTTGIATTS